MSGEAGTARRFRTSASTEIIPLDEANLPAWRRAYGKLEYRCIYAAPDYMAFLARHYGDAAELFLYAEDQHVVYFPYFKRPLADVTAPGVGALAARYDTYSSWYYGGPYASGPVDVAMAERFRHALDEHARVTGCVCQFIRFDANAGNAVFFDDDTATFDRPTVYVDLRQDWQAVESGFHDSNRRAIKKARASGLATRAHGAADDEAWASFARAYAMEMQRKDAQSRLRFEPEFFSDLRRSLPDNTILIGAWQGNIFAGGFIVVFDESHAFHFLSASDPDFWPQRVNNLLFSDAIGWARDNGKILFDFMGGRPGVFKFKSLFSPARGRFFVRRKIYDQELYDALSAAAGASGGASSFFPAYRAA